MTERRFTTNKYYIYDHQEEDSWLCNEVEVNEIVEVMNNLDIKSKEQSKKLSILQKKYNNIKKENKQLKSLLECSREEANDYCEELMEKDAFIRVYKEQNEWLKAQLRKGEDICSICKHRYLTKTNTDKYYIAKCKKEHIECSKGTVNYCEDFEYVKILDLFRRITKGDV